jgi:uncharacterized protein (DUF1697 family)
MKTYISMLRGINVSGQKKISMADLKKLYESLGLINVQTYVQSGNVVFESKLKDDSKLPGLIKNQILKTLGYDVVVLIRSAEGFNRIITNNPFLKKRNGDTSNLYVTFLDSPPSKDQKNNLDHLLSETDEFVMGECEIFLFCPGGYGNTKLSNNYFERKLKIAATTRNWNSINALFNLAIKS